MRFEGGRSGPPTVGIEVSGDGGEEGGEGDVLKMSMSEGVTYCVPATHWKFDIVGLGGMRACGLNSLSSDLALQVVSKYILSSVSSIRWQFTVVGLYPTY